MRVLKNSLLELTLLSGLAAGLVSGSAMADLQKPSRPDGVNAQAINSSSVRVSWNQSWDNVGVEGYNIYRNNQYYLTVFSTNYIDYEVANNGHYEYAIVAFDAAKNYTILSDKAAVTVGDNNNQPAAAPTNNNQNLTKPSALRSTVKNGNEAIVYWTAPQGNVKGYNVYRDGGYLASTSNTEFNDTQLSWGQDHRYHIVAYSHSNTYSERSAELLVNTANTIRSADRIQSERAPLSDSPVQQSGGVPAGYHQVFADEFQQYSLDSNKWNSQYRWGPWLTINDEKQFYVNSINSPDFGHSPFEFDGENMTISAVRTPEHLQSSANWKPYLSGVLTTYNKFKMKYGYVEIRAKLPKGKGLWSAFWLLHNNEYNNRPEIDIVEYIGDKPNVAYNTYHYYENGNLKSSPTMEASGPDYSQEFHTYAIKWEPGLITWYVDGVERNTYQNGNASWEEMYLLVNLAVGGAWAGDPDGSTQLPARLTIDYIRAYQKN
ncbi:MAG: glycoside hydrolase family 16 protein [Granulosicoccaceae bacterium]